MGDVTNYPLAKGPGGAKQAINLLLGMAELVEAGVLDPGLFHIAVENQTVSMQTYSGQTIHQTIAALGVELQVCLTGLGLKHVTSLLNSNKWGCT